MVWYDPFFVLVAKLTICMVHTNFCMMLLILVRNDEECYYIKYYVKWDVDVSWHFIEFCFLMILFKPCDYIANVSNYDECNLKAYNSTCVWIYLQIADTAILEIGIHVFTQCLLILRSIYLFLSVSFKHDIAMYILHVCISLNVNAIEHAFLIMNIYFCMQRLCLLKMLMSLFWRFISSDAHECNSYLPIECHCYGFTSFWQTPAGDFDQNK